MNKYQKYVSYSLFILVFLTTPNLMNAQSHIFDNTRNHFNESHYKPFAKKIKKLDKLEKKMQKKGYNEKSHMERIEIMENFITEYPTNAALLFFVGKEYIRLDDSWASILNRKGRELLQKSIDTKPSPEAYDELYNATIGIPQLFLILSNANKDFPNDEGILSHLNAKLYKMKALDELEERYAKIKIATSISDDIKLKYLKSINMLHAMKNPEKKSSLDKIKLADKLRAEVAKLPPCDNSSRIEKEIQEKKLALNKAEQNNILFLAMDRKSTIKSYPSYYRIKTHDSWIYFYFKNENEVYAEAFSLNSISKKIFPDIEAYNFFLTAEWLNHDAMPLKLSAKGLSFKFNASTNKAKRSYSTISLNISNGRLFTSSGEKVFEVSLFSSEKDCFFGDCINGQGILYDPTHKVENTIQPILAQGTWEQGKLSGTGRINYLDLKSKIKRSRDCSLDAYLIDQGSYYEGEFVNGLYHGYGKFKFFRHWMDQMTATYKNVKVGEFSNGKFIGKAEMTRWAKVQASISREWRNFENKYGKIEVEENEVSRNNLTCNYELIPTGSHETTGDEKSEYLKIKCNGQIVRSGGLDVKIYKRLKYSTVHGSEGFYKRADSSQDPFLGKTEKQAVSKICGCE